MNAISEGQNILRSGEGTGQALDSGFDGGAKPLRQTASQCAGRLHHDLLAQDRPHRGFKGVEAAGDPCPRNTQARPKLVHPLQGFINQIRITVQIKKPPHPVQKLRKYRDQGLA